MAQREGHPTGRDPRPWWKKLFGIGAPACAQRQLTPDEDLQIAFRASADGDLEHAAFHAGAVLKANPVDRRAMQLLDRLIAKCKEGGVDPLTLAPMGKSAWVGTAATHAYVLHALGRHAEAMNLLRQAAHVDAATPWWRLAAMWAADPEAAREMDAEHAAAALSRPVMELPDPSPGSEWLETVLPALGNLATAHPHNEPVNYMRILALRKVGRVDEAVRLAQQWHAASPSYMSALSLANARKRGGDIDGAIAGYEQALTFQPGNAPVMADAAETLASVGRFEEALAWTARAKASDPKVETSSWILWHHLMHKLGRDDAATAKLGEFRRAHKNLREPAEAALRHFGAYAAFIPEPTEATINVVRDLAKEHDIKKVKLTEMAVTSIEAPSSRLAAERAIGIERNGLKTDCGEIPTPDPRLPRGPVDWTIWKYDGTTPLPGLEPPGNEVRDAVAALASLPYDPVAWSAHARTAREPLIQECGSAQSAARELLATMVYPPPAPGPDGQAEWTWIRHVQFAAAMMIVRIDDGWSESVRRRGLIALVRGPVDWTTEAGIVMLAMICDEPDLDESDRREIGRLFKELSDGLPSVGYCCYAYALGWAVMRLPAEAGVDRAGDFAALWERLRAEES